MDDDNQNPNLSMNAATFPTGGTSVISPGSATITVTHGHFNIQSAYVTGLDQSSVTSNAATTTQIPVAPVHQVAPAVVAPAAPVPLPTSKPVTTPHAHQIPPPVAHAVVPPFQTVPVGVGYHGYPGPYPGYYPYPIQPGIEAAPVLIGPKLLALSVWMIIFALNCYVAQGTTVGVFGGWDPLYTGFWAGSVFMLNGVVGVTASRSTNRALIITCLSMCIISQLTAVTMFGLSVYVFYWYIREYYYYWSLGLDTEVIFLYVAYADLILASIIVFGLASGMLHRCRVSLTKKNSAVAPIAPPTRILVGQAAHQQAHMMQQGFPPTTYINQAPFLQPPVMHGSPTTLPVDYDDSTQQVQMYDAAV